MRWIDSALLSHEPLSSVYKGIIPWANIHRTKVGVKWPAKSSITTNTRNGGNSRGSVIRHVESEV